MKIQDFTRDEAKEEITTIRLTKDQMNFVKKHNINLGKLTRSALEKLKEETSHHKKVATPYYE